MVVGEGCGKRRAVGEGISDARTLFLEARLEPGRAELERVFGLNAVHVPGQVGDERVKGGHGRCLCRSALVLSTLSLSAIRASSPSPSAPPSGSPSLCASRARTSVLTRPSLCLSATLLRSQTAGCTVMTNSCTNALSLWPTVGSVPTAPGLPSNASFSSRKFIVANDSTTPSL
ncbi:hypothetical protein EW146_g8531 [Bondarzewia mesenterica]|uniref:Uncharacterized protein n=1 Tax=Bondarzewia mesenterica TaxID=1095465 RepID=A0A4S4LFE0_9AGAM|nr:hypothetical protein EW146_g8531 [Bondarzewia mesenterica]